MGTMITRDLSRGDVSWDISLIHGSDNGSRTDLNLTMTSGGYPSIDVSFEYRLGFGDKWKEDAVISISSSGYVSGNIIRGLPASADGETTRIRWEYEDNKLSSGSTCDIRLRILPSIMSFSRCGMFTSVEIHGDSQRPRLEAVLPFNVIGIDSSGNFICLGTNRIFGVNKDGDEQFEITGLSAPSYACEKEAGVFIIADPGSTSIIEATTGSVVTSIWTSPVSIPNPRFVSYDKSSGNILVTDGTMCNAYEVAWDGMLHGTVSWSFGSGASGSDIDHLNNPCGITYDATDENKIIVADEGNNRVMIIDRSGIPEVVSVITQVSLGEVQWDLMSPSWVISNPDGSLFISSRDGKQLSFGEVRSEHPTLTREDRDYTPSQYRNLVFSPIMPAIEGGG